MKPTIYFRQGDWTDTAEFDAAKRYFHTVRCRTEIPTGRLVIPRYSMLPFPEELVADVKNLGGRLINTVQQHDFVADISIWSRYLNGLTPPAYFQWANLPKGAYVIKGFTNSRKHEWRNRMFAPTREDIPRIVNSLLDDDLIKSQGIVVRPYVPLRKLGEGINGLPISNEWRFFVVDGLILCGGFYWASEPDCCPTEGPCTPPNGALTIAHKAIARVGTRIPFFVVDVAEKADGDWIVIELNDGCMSGLSMIPPDMLYKALAEHLGANGD